MSEENTVSPVEEKEVLMKNLDRMGIAYKGNYGVDRLRELYNNAINGETSTDAVSDEDESTQETKRAKEAPKSKLSQELALRNKIRSEALRIVRCRIVNNHPDKSGGKSKGEFVSISNKVIGDVKKFIPFGEAGASYHIPYCIYEFLKNKKMQQLVLKNKNGVGMVDTEKTQMVPEYNIEILPPLTEKELSELARVQMAKQGISADEA